MGGHLPTSLEAVTALVKGGHSRFHKVDLSDNGLDASLVQPLASAISSNGKLRSLKVDLFALEVQDLRGVISKRADPKPPAPGENKKQAAARAKKDHEAAQKDREKEEARKMDVKLVAKDLHSASACVIAALIRSNPTLTSLDLQNNFQHADDEDARQLIADAVNIQKLLRIKFDNFWLPLDSFTGHDAPTSAPAAGADDGVDKSLAVLDQIDADDAASGSLIGRCVVQNDRLRLLRWSNGGGKKAVELNIQQLKGIESVANLDLYSARETPMPPTAAAVVAACVAVNKGALETLNLDGCELDVKGLKGLDASAQAIDLSAAGLHVGSALFVASCLQTNRVLTSLSLRANRHLGSGIIAIGKALQSNGTLRSLDLAGNAVDERAACALADGLASTTCSLTSLDINDSGGGFEGSRLADVASRKPALDWFCGLPLRALRTHARKELHLRGAGLCNPAARVLAELVLSASGASPLTSFDVSGSSLDAAHAKGIASALMVKQVRLTSLDLTRCQLDDEGGRVVAEYARATASLTWLALLGNAITSSGADLLRQACDERPLLTTLCGLASDCMELSFSYPLGEADVKLLRAEMESCPALQSFDLSDGVRFEAKSELRELLNLWDTMNTLTSLTIRHTHLGAKDTAHIAILVAKSTALVSLALVDCHLTDGGSDFSGVQKIVDALLQGTSAGKDDLGGRLCSLRVLDLSHNLLARRKVDERRKPLTVSHEKLEPYMRNAEAGGALPANVKRTYIYGPKYVKVVGNFEKGALYRYNGEAVHVVGAATGKEAREASTLNVEVHRFHYSPWIVSRTSPTFRSSLLDISNDAWIDTTDRHNAGVDAFLFASVVKHSPLHSLNLAHTRVLAVQKDGLNVLQGRGSGRALGATWKERKPPYKLVDETPNSVQDVQSGGRQRFTRPGIRQIQVVDYEHPKLIQNTSLAEALKEKQTFTQEELTSFGPMPELNLDSIIMAGDKCFEQTGGGFCGALCAAPASLTEVPPHKRACSLP